jgi:hypothetical protein
MKKQNDKKNLRPSQGLSLRILTLPYNAWQLRHSYEICVESSMTAQLLHSICWQNKPHVGDTKVHSPLSL